MNRKRKEEPKSVNCYKLANKVMKVLAGKCSFNEAITALCYAIALLMINAEVGHPENKSDGVADMCRDAIQRTYDMLKTEDDVKEKIKYN